MRDPAFWWRRAGIAATLLRPAAAIYGSIAAHRMRRRGTRAAVPVICVGNLTLGGAGKTPTVLAIARMLLAAGERPFLLSRGHGGALTGPVQVVPAQHGAGDVGDEPLLLAAVAPTIVARDRVAGAALAVAAGASVIVMDDGFQNPGLHKDLSIVVIDARRGIGNGLVFPAGPLRAPLAAQMTRAQAILQIGGTAAPPGLPQPGIPTTRFHARLVPDRATVAALSGRRLLAFAGIADPEKFFATLESHGLDVAERHGFPDHHRYRDADCAHLVDRARARALVPVTTEKDMVRVTDPTLRAMTHVLPVTLEFGESDLFRRTVLDVLAGDADRNGPPGG